MIRNRRVFDRYEKLRLDCELKQGDIANILSVKRNTYSKWENGMNDMPLDKSKALANYYQTSLDYLLVYHMSKILF